MIERIMMNGFFGTAMIFEVRLCVTDQTERRNPPRTMDLCFGYPAQLTSRAEGLDLATKDHGGNGRQHAQAFKMERSCKHSWCASDFYRSVCEENTDATSYIVVAAGIVERSASTRITA